MPKPTTFAELVSGIIGIINVIIPLIFAVVFLIIVWKIIDAWVINGGDERKREEGRQLLGIGVVVFVLMFVSWGVIAMIRTALFG